MASELTKDQRRVLGFLQRYQEMAGAPVQLSTPEVSIAMEAEDLIFNELLTWTASQLVEARLGDNAARAEAFSELAEKLRQMMEGGT